MTDVQWFDRSEVLLAMEGNSEKLPGARTGRHCAPLNQGMGQWRGELARWGPNRNITSASASAVTITSASAANITVLMALPPQDGRYKQEERQWRQPITQPWTDPKYR